MNVPADHTSPQSSNTGPLAAFALMAMLWGYNWVVMKVAMRFCGPLDFAALRVALGVMNSPADVETAVKGIRDLL